MGNNTTTRLTPAAVLAVVGMVAGAESRCGVADAIGRVAVGEGRARALRAGCTGVDANACQQGSTDADENDLRFRITMTTSLSTNNAQLHVPVAVLHVPPFWHAYVHATA